MNHFSMIQFFWTRTRVGRRATSGPSGGLGGSDSQSPFSMGVGGSKAKHNLRRRGAGCLLTAGASRHLIGESICRGMRMYCSNGPCRCHRSVEETTSLRGTILRKRGVVGWHWWLVHVSEGLEIAPFSAPARSLARLASRHQAKARHGWHGMAWHGMAWHGVLVPVIGFVILEAASSKTTRTRCRAARQRHCRGVAATVRTVTEEPHVPGPWHCVRMLHPLRACYKVPVWDTASASGPSRQDLSAYI